VSNRILERFREYIHSGQFNALKIGLASPEKILSLSYGEVKKIETINYRTLKPERDGLFCARIFGPVKDWECNCGKYKRMKHRGITCEKCGVEVIQSRVRRERMGHIKLVAPVVHIWYLKGIPSYLGLILDMQVRDLERVVYFDAYMVIHQGKSPYPRKTVLESAEYEKYLDLHPEDLDFKAEMGAEAIYQVLSILDLELEIAHLKEAYEKTVSVALRHKIMRSIKVLNNLLQAKLRPEWMVLTVLPVLPPDLRPLVPLPGGRFASSDLNELYRRVLNRNIRLQRLIEIDAPSVIIKNEKRMLQEAFDTLIDNGRRGQPVRSSNRRSLKSLSDTLRGKQGRFRQNLLGKRVDYSGRSVIVVDPELRMDQCGLPKVMALELFKSHVFAGLLERELAPNLRSARRMVEDGVSEVWDVLADVVKDHPVMLNRAPTLHRLGVQAFYPILVDGKAIKVHPLVCSGFNADFDGDQMAVHIPLSRRAIQESKSLMLSTNNLLSPANGGPVAVPSQDMVLGLYYMTKLRYNTVGSGTVFASLDEVVMAYNAGAIALHAPVKVRLQSGVIVDTTTGRMLLYEALPDGSDVQWINKVMTRSDLKALVDLVHHKFGDRATVACLDKLKQLGCQHATFSGVSFTMDGLITIDRKHEIITRADKEVEKVERLFKDGIITNGERYNKVVSIWYHATSAVSASMTKRFKDDDRVCFLNEDGSMKPFNPVFMMLDSGAKGSADQMKQVVGMRGLMSKPSGEVMETPVKANFKEGLSVFEYFVSTHGARKGQSDTALRTANSGYLTRRLVDVAQDMVVSMYDCKTDEYFEIEQLQEGGDIIYPLAQRVYGRVLARDLKDPITGAIIFTQGHMLLRNDLEKITASAVASVPVRSVLTCHAKRGVCILCYGMDLSKRELVEVGAPVGIVAAQSIGEPGTQLTMRTFHIGGTAILSEQSSFIAKHEGIVQWRNVHAMKNRDGELMVMNRNAKIAIMSPDGRQLQIHVVDYGSRLHVSDGETVSTDKVLVSWDPNNRVILTEKAGFVQLIDLIENVTTQVTYNETTKRSTLQVLDYKSDKHQPAVSIVNELGEEVAQYYVPTGSEVMVTSGQKVAVGDILVKISRETSKSRDITIGALPRIAELFEARVPKDAAILADIDGEVLMKGIVRGLRKVSVINHATGESYDYFIPREKQLNVVHGNQVMAGEQLTSGSPAPQDLLRIMGVAVLQRYMVNQIQEIYRHQGVNINDRHIELIIRQTLRKMRVIDPGDTEFLIGDRVDRIHLAEINRALASENKRQVAAKPMLMGITIASSGSESFLSAASFQETTRILSEAALSGQVDYLYGLKENVIIGRLIAAGTGVESFRKKYLGGDVKHTEYEEEGA